MHPVAASLDRSRGGLFNRIGWIEVSRIVVCRSDAVSNDSEQRARTRDSRRVPVFFIQRVFEESFENGAVPDHVASRADAAIDRIPERGDVGAIQLRGDIVADRIAPR